jgi:hypothetical protein
MGDILVQDRVMGEKSNDDLAPQYWYNVRTGEVEEGRQSSWSHLMGPYDTREDAARALDTARRRTDAWDDDDARWRGADQDDAHE